MIYYKFAVFSYIAASNAGTCGLLIEDAFLNQRKKYNLTFNLLNFFVMRHFYL